MYLNVLPTKDELQTLFLSRFQMNLTKLLCISAVSICMSSFADTAIMNKSDLYGSWQCEHDFSEPQKNMRVMLNYTINLMKNGTSVGNADLLFSMGGMPTLKYKEVDTALWRLQGNQLQFVSNNIQFINVSHPEPRQAHYKKQPNFGR